MSEQERLEQIQQFINASIDFVLTEDDINVQSKNMVIQSYLMLKTLDMLASIRATQIEIRDRLYYIDINTVAIRQAATGVWKDDDRMEKQS